jgi:hypothetical protein
MWARIVNALLGLWLMAAPWLMGYADPARTHDRIIGPLVASIAIIACTECMRPVRWANLCLGVWLLCAPWLLGYTRMALLNSMMVGILMSGCALVRGRITHHFGGGWTALLKGTSDPSWDHR